MQMNPLSNTKVDLLNSFTAPADGAWNTYAVPDLSKYSFISIVINTTDDGSYTTFLPVSDFANINATNALILYGTTNPNRIMASYGGPTVIGIYNTHGSCTVTIRGFV